MNTLPIHHTRPVRDEVCGILSSGPLPLRDIARQLSVAGYCDLEVEGAIAALIASNVVTREPVYRLVANATEPVRAAPSAVPDNVMDMAENARKVTDELILRAARATRDTAFGRLATRLDALTVGEAFILEWVLMAGERSKERADISARIATYKRRFGGDFTTKGFAEGVLITRTL